jgi:hypothetical protein
MNISFGRASPRNVPSTGVYACDASAHERGKSVTHPLPHSLCDLTGSSGTRHSTISDIFRIQSALNFVYSFDSLPFYSSIWTSLRSEMPGWVIWSEGISRSCAVPAKPLLLNNHWARRCNIRRTPCFSVAYKFRAFWFRFLPQPLNMKKLNIFSTKAYRG